MPILAVVGATTTLGRSVIHYVIRDRPLRSKYSIRAITDDVDSAAASSLRDAGITDIVRGDYTDRDSLSAALASVHTVFATTLPNLDADPAQIFTKDYNAGKLIADLCVDNGVEYLIYSTLPSPKTISGGKYAQVFHFESKAAVEGYIRTLPIKSAFISPGVFMSCFTLFPSFRAKRDRTTSDGKKDAWVLEGPMRPDVPIPLLNAMGDAGKFVGTILAEPDRFVGSKFCAATGCYTMEQVAVAMTMVAKQPVQYRQIDKEAFIRGNEDLPNHIMQTFVEVFTYGEEFGGYYGPETADLVRWATENVGGDGGELSTLKEYFDYVHFELEEAE